MESRGIRGVGLDKGWQESPPISSCGPCGGEGEAWGSEGTLPGEGCPAEVKVIEGCGGSLVECFGLWLWNMAGSFQQKSRSPSPRGHGAFFLLPGHFQRTICAIFGSVDSRGFLCGRCSCFCLQQQDTSFLLLSPLWPMGNSVAQGELNSRGVTWDRWCLRCPAQGSHMAQGLQ